MNLLVGKNKIIYEILLFLESNEPYINIYGINYISFWKKLGYIIKKYYEERSNNNKENNLDFSLNFHKGIKSMDNINNNKNSNDLNFTTIKSMPLISEINLNKKIIEKDLDDNTDNIFNENYNNIYFIYIKDKNISIDKIKNIKNKKVIFSSENIMRDSKNSFEIEPPYILKTEIEYNKLNDKFIPNEFIENQDKDVVKSVLEK